MKKALLLIVVCLSVTNCKTSSRTTFSSAHNPSLRVQHQLDALKNFQLEFTLMPGQVSLIHFPYFGPFTDEALVCNDAEIPFDASIAEHRAHAYLSLSYFDKQKTFSCHFRFSDEAIGFERVNAAIGKFRLAQFSYPSERLNVDRSKVSLSKEDAARVARETKILAELFKHSDPRPQFNEAFETPLKSKVTSIFGTKRIFNHELSTQHLGTDYRAAVGTKIFPANSGRVVFAQDIFYGGNTVIIDHGIGVFSSYSHLSKIDVKVGDNVDKKTLLGLSGMTGRVNGPHLHWGVEVQGNQVDGDSLVKASQEIFLQGLSKPSLINSDL